MVEEEGLHEMIDAPLPVLAQNAFYSRHDERIFAFAVSCCFEVVDGDDNTSVEKHVLFHSMDSN